MAAYTQIDGARILSLLICRKIAVRWLVVLLVHPSRPLGRHATSRAKASSVPGITHTASWSSSAAAKPRVPVPKSHVTSLSLIEMLRVRLPTLNRSINAECQSQYPLLCPLRANSGHPPYSLDYLGGAGEQRRSAFGGKPENICSLRDLQLLTQTGLHQICTLLLRPDGRCRTLIRRRGQ
jgi:hypothetical protein